MKLLRYFSSNKLILIDAKNARKLVIVTIFYVTLQSLTASSNSLLVAFLIKSREVLFHARRFLVFKQS